MEDYRKRLGIEYASLIARIANLRTFIKKVHDGEVKIDTDCRILELQLSAMITYRDILHIRVVDEGIEI